MIWPAQGSQFPLLLSLIVFFVNLIVLALILYFAGLSFVGGKRAKISRVFTTALLGAFVYFVFSAFFILVSPSLSWEVIFVSRVFLSIIVWLISVRYFCKTRWRVGVLLAILVLIMIFLELLVKDFLVSLKLFP